MAKAILNNKLHSGNEDEAIRDGWYVKKPDGRVEITQKALVAFLAAQDKMERLAGMIRDGLTKGGSVEGGAVDGGLYVEPNYNYTSEFLKEFEARLAALGVDVDSLKAEVKGRVGKKESAPRLRVWDTVEEDAPKGKRVAPTADGQPLPVPEKAEKKAEVA